MSRQHDVLAAAAGKRLARQCRRHRKATTRQAAPRPLPGAHCFAAPAKGGSCG
jgi:hypothetical protein